MLISTPTNIASAKANRPLQSVKLLAQREDYNTCHIYLPEEPQRLAAVALDGKFYSFFRSLREPIKTVGLLLKLAARGQQVVTTPTKHGHALWIYEPDGSLAKSTTRESARMLPPTFGPADCWIISDRQPGYRICSLKVPDLPDDVVPGLANGQKFYSLYRRERHAGNTLKLATRLVQRGDEVVLLVGKAGYVICVYEPGATMVAFNGSKKR